MGRMPTPPVDGETVRRLRAERFLSRAELARRSKIARQHLAKIEDGQVSPLDHTANKIAAALEVTVEQLSGPAETDGAAVA